MFILVCYDFDTDHLITPIKQFSNVDAKTKMFLKYDTGLCNLINLAVEKKIVINLT